MQRSTKSVPLLRCAAGSAYRTFWAATDATPCVVELGLGVAVVVSVPGPHREGSNQDAAAIVACGGDQAVLIVADGVGGAADGARASRLAVEQVCLALESQAATEAGGADLRASVLEGIEAANRAVQGLGTGAATTLALLHVDAGGARPYHVGDSWVLHVGGRGKLKHRSIDHGPVGYALESGMMAEHEAMHHEERHVVSNIVGAQDMRIELGPQLPLQPRDTLLIATDGLSDNLFMGEVIDTIRRGPIHAAAQTLVHRCLERMLEARQGEPSKADDLTFILYRPRTARDNAAKGPSEP